MVWPEPLLADHGTYSLGPVHSFTRSFEAALYGNILGVTGRELVVLALVTLAALAVAQIPDKSGRGIEFQQTAVVRVEEQQFAVQLLEHKSRSRNRNVWGSKRRIRRFHQGTYPSLCPI